MNDELETIINGGQPEDFSTVDDLDNIESLHQYLDDHDLSDYVQDDDGTRAVLEYDGHIIVLDSYGLGDFYSHRIEATLDPDGRAA
jgi:hypothetical protein